MNEQRAARIAQVKDAFLEGVRRYHPTAKRVELTDDAILDLFELDLLDSPPEEFEQFLAALRDPGPPQPDDEPPPM